MDLSDWIHFHAEVTPDKTAFLFNDRIISYVSFAQSIDSYVQYLARELAIKPGERIAFLDYNSPEMIALLFACARVGGFCCH